MSKKIVKLVFSFFLTFNLFVSNGLAQSVDSPVFMDHPIATTSFQDVPSVTSSYSTSSREMTTLPSREDVSNSLYRFEVSRSIAQAIIALANPKTHITPSHLGHPGSENIAFLYDKAVDALILKTAGYQKEAEDILDYFSARLNLPFEEIKRYADANGGYGILKVVPSVDDPRAVGFANAFDASNGSEEGRATLEYWVTPGPLAFMVMAYLYVNPQKYRLDAIKVGEALLTLQRNDGGVLDGDRGPRNVHTEPHMDAMAVFFQLYEVTGGGRWKTAGEKAWAWFEKNVYRPNQGVIHQGIHGSNESQIFATDAYSWTLAGPAGDRMPLDVLDKMTRRMLSKCLSRVTLEVPDGTTRTVILSDFADVRDMRILADRDGFHPMGSVEWIGGVILALQKNAVRFWQAGDSQNREKARFFKAIAERLLKEAINSFYELEGLTGSLSFYATGQWISTGHGWQTPYFYVKDKQGVPVIRGGSSIAAWPVLPLNRVNPFKINDRYGVVYDAISVQETDQTTAMAYIEDILTDRSFLEYVPTEMVDGVGDSPEMWRFNQNMFKAIAAGNYYAAIEWAQKIVGQSAWVEQAKEQQKRKENEVGGIVDYPWGTPVRNVKDQERGIQRYSLLNEVGAAMWGTAVAHYKLGNRLEAKAWIRSVIEGVGYHQIFAPSGPGYWNALVSWETNPGGTPLDAEMGLLYREVLREMGLKSALPKSVSITSVKF